METILVTGGAGYIGSHICVALLEAGFKVVVADNLSNSTHESLERVQQITGKSIYFYSINLMNEDELELLFQKHSMDAVIHLAGLKAVGESVEKPLHYYLNNLVSLLHLCQCMQKYEVHRLVFSSSATVYGPPQQIPIPETHPIQTENPYGRTKHMSEQILEDFQKSFPRMKMIVLRYFNPIGAHSSGKIGENPSGVPSNIMPYLTQVAIGKRAELQIFGDDYDTRDGSCIRDFVHVVDLADGHVRSIEASRTMRPGTEVYNLGTGKGTTVKELVNAFEKSTGKRIPFLVTTRRPGDIAVSFADPSKAEQELGWKATRKISDMCRDAWRWQVLNPNGYELKTR